MPRLEVTPALLEVLAAASFSERAEVASKAFITHRELFALHQAHAPTTPFASLLRLTRPYQPVVALPSPPTKTPEYLALMKKLRLQLEEEEYQRLVNPGVSTYDHNAHGDDLALTPAQMTKELKSQITTIINVLVSVGLVVYAIWYWTGSSWGLKDAYRVLLCLFFGLLVLIAEVVVFNGYLTKIEDAKQTERRKKEVKTVVASFEVGAGA